MSESFLGEIRIFAGNFAPAHWAICNGQLMPIAQNDALFSLLGTNYGGDGRTNFALPDFRGRIPLHFGSGPPIAGPPLTPRPIGSRGGQPVVGLSVAQIPSHNHPMQGTAQSANTNSPVSAMLATVDGVFYEPAAQADKTVAFPDEVVAPVGGDASHENHMPTMAINYIISLAGTYPSRN